MRKLVSLIVMAIIYLSIFTGCSQISQETTLPSVPTTPLVPKATEPVQTSIPTESIEYQFPEGATISIRKHPNWNENIQVDDFIQQVTGLAITWKNPVNHGFIQPEVYDYDIKLSDTARSDATTYGQYINLMDYQELMPNFFARFNAKENVLYREIFMKDEKTLYVAPVFIIEERKYPAWIYREDIFKKLGLQEPTDWNSFYNTLKVLKSAFPEGYPFAIPGGGKNLPVFRNFAQQFGVDYSPRGFAISEAAKHYEFATTDAMRQMLQKLKLLIDEDLLDPDFTNYSTEDIYEQIKSGSILITHETADLLQLVEYYGPQETADFCLSWFQNIPMVESDLPYAVRKAQVENYGWVIAKASCKDIELAVRFIDWLYSTEGIITTNWGIEGVSFSIDEAGNKYYLEDFAADKYYADLFFGRYRVSGVADTDAILAFYSMKKQAMIRDTITAVKQGAFLSERELEFREKPYASTYEYVDYMDTRSTWLQSFLLGEKDIHNDGHWQEMKDALENKNIQGLLKVFDSIYQR